MTLAAPHPPRVEPRLERSRSSRPSRSDADGNGLGPGWLSLSPTHLARGLIAVRVRGELDTATGGQCRDVLRAAVLAAAQAVRPSPTVLGPPGPSGSPTPRVVCDLEDVEFLSAAGLGVLVEVDQYARAHGVRLALVAATRPVRRVLALTGLDRQLLLCRTPDAAGAAASTASAS